MPKKAVVKLKLDKWDIRFSELAKHVSTWSKDPDAQVGAVIVDERRRVVAVGFNGFPTKVDDSAERLGNKEQKLEMVVHAEENAILIAGGAAENGTIYVFGKPICARCAGVIIQSGIKRAVAEEPQAGTNSKWDKSGQFSLTMFNEAKITFQSSPKHPTTRKLKP